MIGFVPGGKIETGRKPAVAAAPASKDVDSPVASPINMEEMTRRGFGIVSSLLGDSSAANVARLAAQQQG
jgi:hypothetical protein